MGLDFNGQSEIIWDHMNNFVLAWANASKRVQQQEITLAAFKRVLSSDVKYGKSDF